MDAHTSIQIGAIALGMSIGAFALYLFYGDKERWTFRVGVLCQSVGIYFFMKGGFLQ